MIDEDSIKKEVKEEIHKERVYVDEASEAPEWATVHEGDRGGMFYIQEPGFVDEYGSAEGAVYDELVGRFEGQDPEEVEDEVREQAEQAAEQLNEAWEDNPNVDEVDPDTVTDEVLDAMRRYLDQDDME